MFNEYLSSRYYVHFDQFGGLAFEEMLVFLLSEKARRWCAKHSEAAPAPASSERATAETLLKVRKSYISETARRKTGQNVIYAAPLSLTAQNSGCPNPGKSDIIMITVDAV